MNIFNNLKKIFEKKKINITSYLSSDATSKALLGQIVREEIISNKKKK